MITTPIMTMTIMIAMPMYSSALWVAMPLSGVAVGAAVAAGELAWMNVEAEDTVVGLCPCKRGIYGIVAGISGVQVKP